MMTPSLIDQNGNDKSEHGVAVGDLTDLLGRMGPHVPPVGRELVDRNAANIKHRLTPWTPRLSTCALDRLVTDLQNLSGCFHPHCGISQIAGSRTSNFKTFSRLGAIKQTATN
jgi:hypothetical protein